MPKSSSNLIKILLLIKYFSRFILYSLSLLLQSRGIGWNTMQLNFKMYALTHTQILEATPAFPTDQTDLSLCPSSALPNHMFKAVINFNLPVHPRACIALSICHIWGITFSKYCESPIKRTSRPFSCFENQRFLQADSNLWNEPSQCSRLHSRN